MTTFSDTINYYNTNAEAYSGDTVSADLSAAQNRFLALLPKGASILDFGCGSGRDSLYFAKSGYMVSATDGSEKLCDIASRYTGIPARCERFSDLADVDAYDGIWACASILHLPYAQLLDVLGRMDTALKPNGVIYASFKYGNFEGKRNGRWFTDLTEESFSKLLGQVEGLKLIEQWLSADVRPGRGDEQWLNCLILKR